MTQLRGETGRDEARMAALEQDLRERDAMISRVRAAVDVPQHSLPFSGWRAPTALRDETDTALVRFFRRRQRLWGALTWAVAGGALLAMWRLS